MKQTNTRQRRAKRFGALVALAGVSFAAAACGSDDDEGTSTPEATSPASVAAPTEASGVTDDSTSATSATDDPVQAGIEHAKAEIAKYLPEPAPFEAQGPPVAGDVGSLAGGEVWFIPIAYNFVPYFAVVEKGLQDALGELDVTVRLCDAAADPTIGATCVADATRSGAAGIITGAVPYEFAPNAFDDATAAGIPVIYMDTGYPSERGDTNPWPELTGYVSFDGAKATALVADWMIVDSGGEANVLAIRVSDTDWTKATMSNGAVKEFEQYCPNCVVEVVDSNAAQTAERPAVVAGALAANPDTNYVLPNYDSTVEPSGALEGVTNAGYLDKVKAGTTTGQLSGLQLIADGKFLHANAGANNYQAAWAAADQFIRLSLGEDPVMDPAVQLRLFTAENVGELTLTQEEFLVGSFFGLSGFQDVYRGLWGLS